MITFAAMTSSQISGNIGAKLLILISVACIAENQVINDGDELCDINNCPNDARCLRRHGPGNLTYVCECVQEDREVPMGHDCNIARNGIYDNFKSCYGKSCERGSFASPNYPSNYRTRYRTLMALYIPHAKSIFFNFSSPFCIEKGKDELYVGSGLEISYDDIEDVEHLRENLYHFDGDEVPYNFSLPMDTALIYFASDKSTVCEGFNITWEATVDYIPPVVSNCPADMSLIVSKVPVKINWTEPIPHAPDGDDIYTTSDFPEYKIFSGGLTVVKYRFADIYENAATCEFNVNVTIDDIAPIIHGCPFNMFHNVTYPNTSMHVYWIEPSATDNVATVGDIRLTKTHSPGDLFENGTHQVQYTAMDPYGNTEHCTFIVEITVQGEDEPSSGTLVQLIPLVICGAIFTLISCVCCLGRSVKKVGSYRETTSKSKQENQSTGNSGQRQSTTNRSSGLISSDNSGLVLSLDGSSSESSSGSSGYSSGDKSLDTIDEINGTDL